MGNVLYVNKPKNMTSFDVCFKLRKVLGTKKIGHTGTLDPNATGVMIVLYNNATKANQFLVTDSKEYITTVKLGIETDTLDIDGNIINQSSVQMPSKEELISCLNSFLGNSLQQVPITSAVKVDGKKLLEYQRQNIEVELPYREINVYSIKLLDINDDTFRFVVSVSSGTYIRALVRDILAKLNIIGTVLELERSKVDNIDISDCDSLEDILSGKYTTHDLLDVMSKRYIAVSYSPIEDIINGKRIKIDLDDDKVIIVKDNVLYAIYEKDGDEYKCLRGLLWKRLLSKIIRFQK